MTEFDSEDVKWTYDTIMDEDSGSVVWSWYNRYIESVEVVDKYTVKFTLKGVWPDFETAIASRIYGYIKSKEAFEKYGEDYGTKAVRWTARCHGSQNA
jgi:ABC-type transport system substrate-binding protein